MHQHTGALNYLIFIYIGVLALQVRAAPNATRSAQVVIVTPSQTTPAIVSDIDTIEIKVRLRLPLTPPPGVQQPAANKGWRIALSRDDFVNQSGQLDHIRYTLPLLRLRPFQEDIYRIVVELPPWLPDGHYDLTVLGPGFSATKPQAIRKGTPKTILPKNTNVPNMLSIEATLDTVHLPIIISKDVMGIRVAHQDTVLLPQTIVPALLPDNGSRVAFYHLSSGPARSLRIEQIKKSPPCQTSFKWQSLSPNETLEWRNLTVQSPSHPQSTIWDFGDGRYGEGEQARHRFLLHNKAKVTVMTYDINAAVCTHQQEISLNPLKLSNGCGCTLIGR